MGSDIPVYRDQWAQHLVRKMLLEELTAIQEIDEANFVTYGGIRMPLRNENEPIGCDNLPRDIFYGETYRDESQWHKPLMYPHRKVCIVGAGVAGLYIAMILDDLQIPNLKYDIFEANERVGGRVFTHHFSKEQNDFYEVGAMRFPCIPTMWRTFNLFERTNVKTIKYYLTGENCPSLFNERFHVGGVFDPYHVSKSNRGSVPDDVVDRVDNILKDTFGEYTDAIAEDPEEGFDKLMGVDDFSTREYLKRGGGKGKPSYNFFAIQWMETQSTSSNLFDQAFSESVLDSTEFQDPDIEWFCISGGSSVLIDKMQKIIKTEVKTGARVSAISFDPTNRTIAGDNMSVQIASEGEPREGYCTVFATTTLPCLRRMDLRTLGLHPSQKDAIWCLHYDDSTKVALKFSRPWWINDCEITQGGTASTDLPLRTCVYPSYNLKDGEDKPAVLLASYTWSQDAMRVGSLIQRGDEHGDELKELILKDLARLHANFLKEGPKKITYEKLKALCQDHHAWSWSHDPHMGGAFALFGPGQFSNFYPYLVLPAADSKFHMVGEASSVHHAWIAGALNSAYMAVYKFLYRYRLDYGKFIGDLENRWGKVHELEVGEYGTVHLQNFLGTLRK